MDNASVNGFIDPIYEIETVDDVDEAMRRAAADERIVVAPRGQPPVAVIPLIDLKLLLRLEDEELDRIDAEDLRQLRETEEYHDRVSWDAVKTMSHL